MDRLVCGDIKYFNWFDLPSFFYIMIFKNFLKAFLMRIKLELLLLLRAKEKNRIERCENEESKKSDRKE